MRKINDLLWDVLCAIRDGERGAARADMRELAGRIDFPENDPDWWLVIDKFIEEAL